MLSFPQYSGVTYLWGNRGNSSWNSLQITFDRRFAQGLTFHAGYTYSKELDNLAASRNPFDGHLERARGSIDRPHVFIGTIVYNLPFGAGHHLASGNSLLRALASHWLVSGLVNFVRAPGQRYGIGMQYAGHHLPPALPATIRPAAGGADQRQLRRQRPGADPFLLE
jgi:hypothetical protein